MKRIISIALALALVAAGGGYAAGWAVSRPVPAEIGAAPESLVGGSPSDEPRMSPA